MEYTWSSSAPDGVARNHALSSKLREAAIAETKFMQFVDPEPGYGKKKGESVTIERISNIEVPDDARLSENQPIPEDEFVVSTISITVTEWGRAVPYTNLATQLTNFDLESKVQGKLKEQMRLILDSAAAAAFKTGKIKAIPDGASSLAFDTDGTASTTASSNLNMYHIERIRDYMFSTLNVPAFSGDDYIGLISTKAKRGIMDSPSWEPWHRYTDPQSKYNSEVGRMENIRFIEVNNTAALSGTLGSGGVLGEAVIFGADAVSMAVVLDPELRKGETKDFGRSMAVAWYGILEFGQIWADSANPGEARIVHVTSA